MQWLTSNWIWIVAIAAIFAMHRFGHGGHRHGSRHGLSGHAHGSRRSEAGWSGDRLGEARPSSLTDGPQAAHVGHAQGAVGETSGSVPAASGAATHTEHGDRPVADGRRRHRHSC